MAFSNTDICWRFMPTMGNYSQIRFMRFQKPFPHDYDFQESDPEDLISLHSHQNDFTEFAQCICPAALLKVAAHVILIIKRSL